MARNENPPFERGYVDSTGAFATCLGKTFVFEDLDYSSAVGAKPTRTGKYVTVMVAKNGSGFTILPKRLVKPSTTANEVGIMKGYVSVTADYGYPVDEFIPSAGVPDGSYFYVVVQGPAVILTSLSAISADVVVGDVLVGITGATTGATTSGRLAKQDLTGATALLGNQVMNKIGRALSAATTGNTNSNLLVDVQTWF
jgi:hypothetical protein